ncbi:MAG: hypothetical protein ACI4MA_00460 [Treponema sp.]
MTDTQLDIKATEASLAYNTKYAEDSVLNDMLSRPSDFSIKSVANMLRKKAYRDGYEQGYEQGFKGHKKENDKLKQQIEKMKNCRNCRHSTNAVTSGICDKCDQLIFVKGILFPLWELRK